ncbi:hypothetical protein NX059_007125 [Plenodomus lindquistii]|nr:hypothetical protein NX059_007125 [Plenodomus lindquistii]
MKLPWLLLLVLALSIEVLGLAPSILDLKDSAVLNTSSQLPANDNILLRPNGLFRRSDWDPSLIADDATWNKAVANGQAINCLMRRTDKDAGKVMKDQRNPPSAESRISYTSKAEGKELLKKWNWLPRDPGPDALKLTHVWGWKNAIVANGLNSNHGNQAYRVEHWDEHDADPKDTQSYIVDGHNKWATGARAAFVLHRNKGIIFIQDYSNAKLEFQRIWNRVPSDDEIPPIRSLSDILWSYWITSGGPSGTPAPQPLRHYGVLAVKQPAAKSIIIRALDSREPRKWPGSNFQADSEIGKALIGTIGASLAQFLFEHKPQLGLHHIREVTVFRNGISDSIRSLPLDPAVLFYVEPVPQNLLIPQEADDWQPHGSAGTAAAATYDTATNTTSPVYDRDGQGNYFRTHML